MGVLLCKYCLKNMKTFLKISILFAFTLLLANCGPKNASVAEESAEVAKCNSIYYWKTTFELSSAEVDFLANHNVKRLYLRMFDVAVEQDFLNGVPEIVPIATTKFVSEVPQEVEVVPVTYITIEALRAMMGNEAEFAELIVDRLLAMASYNKCGNVKEIQLDCDWTTSTKYSYDYLCQLVKERLDPDSISVSSTIRLHQLNETAPPVDKGVLMLYNAGALKDPDTTNSILNIDDVKPYIKKTNYPIPLDYAYPVFGWGVKFENNKFLSIVSADEQAEAPQHIRVERPTFSDIMAVKSLVEQNLGKPSRGSILYHLDDSQLKYYCNDEISEIYNY